MAAAVADYRPAETHASKLKRGEAAIGLSQEAPRGVLKVTAPVWCATRRFADALTAYKAAHPDGWTRYL